MLQTMMFLSLMAPGQLPAQGPVPAMVPGAACCDAGCAGPAKTVCVSEPTTKKITKTVYNSKCSEVCYKHCSLLANLFGSGDCGCTECGHPRHKSVLIKKVCTTECPDTKCVPKPADACLPAAPGH